MFCVQPDAHTSISTCFLFCGVYLTLTFSLFQMQCRSGWWLLVGSPLLSSLSWGCLGGRQPAFPFSQLVVFSFCQDKNNCPSLESSRPPSPPAHPPRSDRHSSSPYLGERSSCTRFTFLPSRPSQPTPPRRHGAVTAATRWTVSCPHLFHERECCATAMVNDTVFIHPLH